MYQVSEIYYSPIKSGALVWTDKAQVTTGGIDHDRHWLVINEKQCLLTQREVPALCRVQALVANGSLTVSFGQDGNNVLVELKPRTKIGDPFSVVVFGRSVLVTDAGNEVADFLQEVLGRPCRLARLFRGSHQKLGFSHDQSVNLHDKRAFHLVGTASLAEVSRRAGQKVSALRFRPNLIVETATPHEEDTWRSVKIDDVLLLKSEPCPRCMMVDLNPTTGVADLKLLRLLADYRRNPDGPSIDFGRRFQHQTSGQIKIGDKVVFTV